MEEIEYEIYSSDLMEFELPDVFSALDRIGKTVPGQYESRFPDSATLIKAVRDRADMRRTRITPEQLRPEVREALQRSREYELGQGERVPIGNILEDGKLKELCGGNSPVSRPSQPLKEIEPCAHCGFATSSQDSATLFRMADYYRKLAENAAERETKEQALSEVAP